MGPSSRPLRPATRWDFEIAIICALPTEANEVRKLFEPRWDKTEPPYNKAPGDPNTYSTGAIGRHNVVLVHMPHMGKVKAAGAAASCRSSFPNIKLAVLVGICAAVPFPTPTSEIILGDVIISKGAVQYDFGRQTATGFDTKVDILDNLARPNTEIAGVLAKLALDDARNEFEDEIDKFMGAVKYPGQKADIVFEATIDHKDGDSCGDCGVPLRRTRLDGKAGSPRLKVHLGIVATGDTVMKSGSVRDKIAKERGVIAFEMEAAGVWDTFPCVVIKGACDYADSHKHKAWQQYAAARAAACMKVFLDYFEPSRKQPPPPFEPPTHRQFLVPHPKNERFVGRAGILNDLMERLQPGKGGMASLVGVGGIGKTQIALQYSHACWEENKGFSVFWVQAGNSQQFYQSYASIARRFRVPGYMDPKEDVRPLVKTWLEKDTSRPWLMVLDNADDPRLFSAGGEDLHRFIPGSKHVSILVTTRIETGLGLAGEKPLIQVAKLETGDVSRLLSDATTDGPINTKEMEALAPYIDGLPLAAVQAAAFIRDQRLTIGKYLELLEGCDKRLEDELGEKSVGEGVGSLQAAARTWFLSFDKIQEQNSVAGDLLCVMSCFDSQAVPAAFLPRYLKAQRARTRVGERWANPAAVLEAMSLVSQQHNGDGLDMQRATRSLVQKWLDKKHKRREFEGQALLAVAQAHPVGNAKNRALCSDYLGHGAAVLKFREETLQDDAQRLAKATLLYNSATFHSLQGQWEAAEDLYSRSTALREQGLGDSNPLTLQSKTGLAGLYRKQGRLELAWEYETAIMETRTKTPGIGPEDASVLANKASLALMLGAQGQWGESERLEVEVMEKRKSSSGNEHALTLASMSSLAATYKKQGKWVEAEQLELSVMGTRDRILGDKNALTLTSMSNLATTYRKWGRWEDAEKLELRAVETCRVVFGDDHLPTLTSMANLASIFGARGQWRDALSLEVKVTEMRNRVLGEAHPQTLAAMTSLASTYWKAGEWEEATKVEKAMLRIRKKVLREDDPVMLTTKSNLASMYRKRSMWREAETLEAEVMMTFETKFEGSFGYQVMKSSMRLFASAQRGPGHQQKAVDPIRQLLKLWHQLLWGKESREGVSDDLLGVGGGKGEGTWMYFTAPLPFPAQIVTP